MKDSTRLPPPPELQNAVKQAGLDASYYEWDWIAEKNNTFKQALLNNGMQISDLEDKQKWIDATRHLWNNYYKHIGYGDSAAGKRWLIGFLNLAAVNSILGRRESSYR
jgi:TRAP-type C4-dicarboxylate transport system substrate-binding protein